MCEVCDTYFQAENRLKNEKIHTISVDEKTGIQALEIVTPTKPMRPGVPELREFEYKRHGTQCLTANLEVSTGKIVAPTVELTRIEVQFADHMKRTIATDPKAGWIVVADNLNTHCSETLVILFAGLLAIPVETLGVKGQSGILKSVATRKAFLTDGSHHIRMVFVPKHTSWLNQIEIWFSVLSRKTIKRGNFRSKADLRKRILDFIVYYNETMAKPYKWKYKGPRLNV